MNNSSIQLEGRLFVEFQVKALTGLHIGGSDTKTEIGGVDKTVIRNPLTNQPYIPGSSLRGKMRSLTEKYLGLNQNQRIGQGYIHSCGGGMEKNQLEKEGKADYQACDVCQVYGVPGERPFSTPTRLIVRDVMLDPESVEALARAGTDLPYTEVKTEVSIDRVTSAANPRQLERVPAGALFGPGQLIYSLYNGSDCDVKNDIQRFETVLHGLALLEDDYLGGQGSRGSGRIQFVNLNVGVKTRRDYRAQPAWLPEKPYASLSELMNNREQILEQITAAVSGN